MDSLGQLREDVCACRACPRLVEWREQVAIDKRASYRDQTYWGKPVPGFGDPAAKVLVLGLANQPTSVSIDDGLTLSGAWLAAAVKCAPPDNKPLLDSVFTRACAIAGVSAAGSSRGRRSPRTPRS